MNYNVNEIIEAKGNAVGLKPEDSIKDISDLEDSNYGSTFKKSEPSLSAKEHDNECVLQKKKLNLIDLLKLYRNQMTMNLVVKGIEYTILMKKPI